MAITKEGGEVALTVGDRLEIMELVARYNLAADEKDVEATLAEYADDGVIEGFYSTGRGKEAMRRDLPAVFEAEGTLKRHLAPNLRISGDGDVAGVSYVLLVVEGEERPTVGATALIRDELRKVEGRWLVARHHITVDPSIRVYGQG
jgi:ketosteroid isomerase-like protein